MVVESSVLLHFGWISIASAVLAGAITMWLWPMERDRSFSENVARRRASIIAFAVWLPVVTVLHYGFLIGWLGPTREMGASYYVVAWIMFAFQLLLAWAPATKGVSMLVHNVTSYGLVLLMPVLMIHLAATSTPALHGTQLAMVGAFVLYEMIMMYLFFFVSAARNYFLWFQTSLMALIWTTTLIVAYG